MANKKAIINSAKIVAMTALIVGKANAHNATAQAAVIDMNDAMGGDMITVNGDPFSDYLWDDTRLEYTWNPSRGDVA